MACKNPFEYGRCPLLSKYSTCLGFSPFWWLAKAVKQGALNYIYYQLPTVQLVVPLSFS